MFHIKNKNSKGISLLFVVMIMGVILAVGLGISGILLQQISMTGEIGYSVVSFYAADSGIEQELYDLYRLEDEHSSHYEENIGSNAFYEVVAKCANADTCPSSGDFEVDTTCGALNFCIKSIGTTDQGTKRAIEIEY